MHNLKDDKPSNFIEVNDKFCDTLGYPKEELLKMNIKDLVEKDLHKKLDNNIIKLKHGEDVLFETLIKNKNGEKIPIEIHKSIININENPTVLGIARDISERKIVEEELQKLAAVVKHSGELVNLATLDGKMIFLNEAGEKMLGIHSNQVKKHVIFDVIPNDLQSTVKNQILPSIINEGFWQGELRYKNIETGDETYVYAYTFYVEDPDTNKPMYLANVSRDITEQKRDEIKLEKAHRELKELNEKLEDKVKDRTKQIQNLLHQKDEFINQLGHDLKNPLGPLVNLLPIVEKEEKDPKLKEIIQVINRNVIYMKNLVIKTIQLARLNSPKTEFNYEDANLLEILNSVIDSNRLLLKNSNIVLNNNITENININIDKLRIEELLNNLLNNSIKYSKDSGKIIIDYKNDEDFITISIKDNGIGMTDKQIQHMFEEFYKADEARHDFDSSGLGLSISRKIVEKHGGKIWAESDGIDRGSTFYFTLPKKSEKKV
jgi:PAS domain S-box-containing protein